jgi:hypothetical protein
MSSAFRSTARHHKVLHVPTYVRTKERCSPTFNVKSAKATPFVFRNGSCVRRYTTPLPAAAAHSFLWRGPIQGVVRP